MGIVLKLLRMLPDAFLYQYAGTVASPAGAAGAGSLSGPIRASVRPTTKPRR